MSQPIRILLALAAGLAIGILSAAAAPGSITDIALAITDPIGGLWLDALRMTIVPLIVALLITGIAASADAARSGRLTARALVLMLAILGCSSVLGAVLLPLFVRLWPLAGASGDALRMAMATETPIGDVPGIGQFLRSIVPTNPVAAAAGDAILPLIVFTTIFGFAITRLPPERRVHLTGFFEAVSDAMQIVIGWVLWLAPLGVLALAFAVGARAGTGAVGALVHYVLAVSSVGVVILLLAYPLARLAGKRSVGSFARAVAPAQALAVSTQSSLACLPAMLGSAERLNVPPHAANVVLPIAVALFRATGPAMNLAVALYIAHWLGIPLGAPQIAAGIATAAITTIGAVSLPGQLSFITSIAPIALAMGVPIEPLALLIAVEPLPDIVRTVGNVSMDVAVTTAATRGEPELPGEHRETDGVAL